MARGVQVVLQIVCPTHPLNENEKEQNLQVVLVIMMTVETNEESGNQVNLPITPMVVHHPLTPHTKTNMEPVHQSTSQELYGQIPSQVPRIHNEHFS
jgi:hypothetical protein